VRRRVVEQHDAGTDRTENRMIDEFRAALG
jgi:hypothetical protein